MCDEMKNLISLYIDDELSLDKKAEVDEHIKNCKDCNEYYTQLSEIITELNSLPQITPPENFHADTMKKIKAGKRAKKYIFMSFVKYTSVAAGLLFVITLVSVIGSSFLGATKNSGGAQVASEMGVPTAYSHADTATGVTDAGIQSIMVHAESILDDVSVSNKRMMGQQELVVKSYVISIETDKFDEAIQAIDGLKGSIQASSIYTNYNGEKIADLEIKYSLQNYDFAIDVLKTLGTVQKQNEYSQVLRYDYQDAQARLNAKEVERQRLLELFRKTDSMANMLMLERRLIEVENEADMYRSDLVNYNNRAEYPTVRVYINERLPIEVKINETSFLDRVRDSFIASVNSVGAFIEVLLVLSAGLIIPVIILAVVAIAILIIYKKVGKRGGGDKA